VLLSSCSKLDGTRTGDLGAAVASPAAGGAAQSSLALDRGGDPWRQDRRPGSYGVVVNPIPGLPDDFIMGADVSMLAQIEASGGRFYDERGVQRDCLWLLRTHGVNWVRLRLWNHPVIVHDFQTDGLTIHAGESAGGIDDQARVIGLARRARALGMKVLLDFHYSDWWADPGKQWLPQAWEGASLDQLETSLYQFTKRAVGDMRAAGAGPDMVQIGNEVTNGMLWPLGRIGAGANAFGDFTALLGQASRAVRDVDPRIPVMIHIDRGGDNALYRRFFTNLIGAGVDFDVIGLSYYPYWHGPMPDLLANLNDISRFFNKPVVIAETAYPWTTDDADAEPNSYGGSAAAISGPYLPTVQGQTTFLRDLMAIVAGVPDGRGLGIFYWEPDWIAVPGAGWYTNGGDGWDNQTLFDHRGKVLPSLNVFRAVSEERPVTRPVPVSVTAQPPLLVPRGVTPALPAGANVVYSDASVRSLYVVWDAVDPAQWSTPGAFDLGGRIAGTSLRASLPVTVTLLANPGLETGDASGWTVTDPSSATGVPNDPGNAHSGNYALHWWNAGAFSFTVQQTVTGLEAGKTYSFAFWAMGNAGEPMQGFAICNGIPRTVDFTLTGWPNWAQQTISGLDGSAGQCTVGVTSSARAGDWGNLDDFTMSAED
jgi:arabinogalactan endo-1,4-beta-galactosidase